MGCQTKHSMSRRIAVGMTVFSLVLFAIERGSADDTVLFTSAAAPNVVLMVDNSGSMEHIVWHEEFDPDETQPNCGFTDTSTYYYSSASTQSHCGNTRTIFVDSDVSTTRWQGSYLNWYFNLDSSVSAEAAILADLAATANGTLSSCLGGGTYSKYRRSRASAAKQILREVICQVNAAGEVRFGLAQFREGNDPTGGFMVVPIDDYTSSQDAALDAAITSIDPETWTPLSESMFQIYTYFMSRDTAWLPTGIDGTTKFPKYQYNTSDSGAGGASTTSPPIDPVINSCQKHFVVVITDGEPTQDDFWPSTASTSVGFNDFPGANPSGNSLIGDYNADGENEIWAWQTCGSSAPPVGWPASWNCYNYSSLYLDDIAKYMQDKDFRPDITGTQVIDTYTVGFTTSDFANDLLEKTAQVGNGQFFTSNDPESLSIAIIAAISDIIRKAQTFTAATVPASRTTDGNNIYTSYFIPADADPFWEGHIKNFEFTAAGEIHDANGDCAVDDPGAPGSCESGALLTSAPAFWDTADGIPVPASRTLYVSKTSATLGALAPTFTTTNIAAADLGVVAGDASLYSTSTTDLEDLTDEIVSYARGCEFETAASPCTARTKRLGDIFHSNPVVIGPPNAPINDASYATFASTYSTRTRVLYAGANDGFLHAFNAGTYLSSPPSPATPGYDRGTGVEIFGFMPWQVRDNSKLLPIDTPPRDTYFVDGSPRAADVWFYPASTPAGTATTKVADDWHTVLIGGLREGGTQYYALDVTNPDALSGTGKPLYPAYLWEFPCEASSCDGYRAAMGETWSDPVITRVRVGVDGDTNSGGGYERWVAIFGGGYSNLSDPNSNPPSYSSTATAGRSIYMIDITTGQVLAEKKFNAAATTGDPEGEMLYAIPSTPAVYDLDFDGFADLIYVGDLGGNMWKWVIRDVGGDPINGSGTADDVDQPNWTFEKYFVAPSYTESGTTYYKSLFSPPTGTLKEGHLWLAFGTGERANLNYRGLSTTTADNNRFYVVKEPDPYSQLTTDPLPLIGTKGTTTTGLSPDPGHLDDVTDGANGCSDITSPYGFYIVAREEEKFVTNSVIFLGQVFTGSFIPSPVGTDPCTATGSAFLYQFDLLCGEGANSSATLPADKRRRALGSGMPTAPRVSVGELDPPSGECPNKVVVITSQGELDNDCPGNLPSSGVKLREWRERGQAF